MLSLFGVSLNNFCQDASELVQLIGWVLTIFKVAIPLLIVVLGGFDLGKAVMAGKDDEIKKNAKSLGVRAIAGILIFLLPNIVLAVFGLFNTFNESAQSVNFPVCKKCLLEPWNCSTDN